MNSPDPRLQRRLRSLPEVPPAEDLWPRVARARDRRVGRWRIGIAAGAMLAVGLAVVPLVRDQSNGAPTLVRSPQPPASTLASIDAETLGRIRALDRALQTAYDQGASDDEVAPLWQARRALLPGFDPAAARRSKNPDNT